MSKFLKDKTYYIGVPENPTQLRIKPNFNQTYSVIVRNGADLINFGIMTTNEYFDNPPDLLIDNLIYEIWELDSVLKNGVATQKFNKVHVQTAKNGESSNFNIVNLNNKYDEESLNDKFDELKSSLNQNTDLTSYNEMVRAKDRTIAELYDKLNSIHDNYRLEINKLNEALLQSKAEFESSKKEFETYKYNLEQQRILEERFKTEQEQIKHLYDGKINSLNDRLEATESSTFLQDAGSFLDEFGFKDVVKALLPKIIESTLIPEAQKNQLDAYANNNFNFNQSKETINPNHNIYEPVTVGSTLN